jgi:hypothetical protein
MELISSKHPEKAERIMAAVMQMMKLDIKKLKAAYAGRTK